MIISFGDFALHDACVDLHLAEEAFGSVHAVAIITFISDAEASANASELIDILGGDVKILNDDSLSVAIGTDYRALLTVAGTRFEKDAEGRIVWSSVSRLKLVEVSRLS